MIYICVFSVKKNVWGGKTWRSVSISLQRVAVILNENSLFAKGIGDSKVEVLARKNGSNQIFAWLERWSRRCS